ncbi:3-mercaptopyruvate sulfurtransferase [Sphingomonas colocasiae]|uniref:3-mercaptopyruvate sulfurtransferase n=1 Tax=Sphingomonas colocasiae TaxID=1848973 RepID=A0ABS7PX21_9SPHN|nr:3-mercaptopyruvate sulfurtransferase [Sphingomonas colocasiae]MBY8825908.1 3-mercaptopyruvate sulfurtransferase [Sphingomonas colocasiae]
MDMLVSTEWLAGELGAPDLRVVDATYFLPGGGDAAALYEAAHIPGAVYMDLENLIDTNTDLPNMLPPAEKFASRMQSLGLGDGSRIVLYDDSSLHTAARAWWMLKLFGAHHVAVLDGGFAKWKDEGREVASGKEKLRHRHFTVWKDDATLRTLDQMKDVVAFEKEQIVDARGAARFTGQEPDPRPRTHAGHIPGSKNLPYGNMFEADGRWKSPEGIRAAFEAAGIDLEKPVVTTCGSGITASVLFFGAVLAGAQKLSLYDGSWSEWGADLTTPKATGQA